MHLLILPLGFLYYLKCFLLCRPDTPSLHKRGREKENYIIGKAASRQKEPNAITHVSFSPYSKCAELVIVSCILQSHTGYKWNSLAPGDQWVDVFTTLSHSSLSPHPTSCLPLSTFKLFRRWFNTTDCFLSCGRLSSSMERHGHFKLDMKEELIFRGKITLDCSFLRLLKIEK